VGGFDEDALGRARSRRRSRGGLGEEEQEREEHGAAPSHGARPTCNVLRLRRRDADLLTASGALEETRAVGARVDCCRHRRIDGKCVDSVRG